MILARWYAVLTMGHLVLLFSKLKHKLQSQAVFTHSRFHDDSDQCALCMSVILELLASCHGHPHLDALTYGHIIGQDLDVIERKALGLPPRKLSKARLTSFEDEWNTRPHASPKYICCWLRSQQA